MFLPPTNILKFSKIVHIINLFYRFFFIIVIITFFYLFIYGTISIVKWKDIK